MKKRFEFEWSELSRRYYSLVGVALLLALILSLAGIFGDREHKREYPIGTPWQYDLLVAPYNFPIFKSEEMLQRERDSISRAELSVYSKQNDVLSLVLAELEEEYAKHSEDHSMSHSDYTYLKNKLTGLYSQGLMDSERMAYERERGQKELKILEAQSQTEFRREPLSSFLDLGSAYQKLEEELPNDFDRALLGRLNIPHYIKPNIVYNEEMSRKLLESELQSVTLILENPVLQGERIIDKGELVTPDIKLKIDSLEREVAKRENGKLSPFVLALATFGVLSLLFLVLLNYLRRTDHAFVSSDKNLLFLSIAYLLFIGLSALNFSTGYLIPELVIPYVMFMVLMRSFFDEHLSLVTYVVMILASSLFVVSPLPFILMQSIGGIVALTIMRRFNSRIQLFEMALLLSCTYFVSAVSLMFFRDGTLHLEEVVRVLFYLAFNHILLLSAYFLTVAVEKFFGYVSNTKLVEISDVNSPLLRQLSEQAPGTFQHSYQVSILASEAADKVGGNVLLIRAGALYHDIGKLKNPSFFTENQGGTNPHGMLSYEESSRLIINHVEDGVILAEREGLPDVIIDFIKTHHGKGMTKYFYISYCNEHPDEEVDPARFSYQGPNPTTKEQGILMLADSVEASSRSLKEYTEESIHSLMDKVIDGIIAEGLLSETPLTFRDIEVIKEVFLAKLKIFYHSRISYPDRKQ